MASCWPKASATACSRPTTPSSSTRRTSAVSTSTSCWAISSSSSMARAAMTSSSSSPLPPSTPPALPSTSVNPDGPHPSSRSPGACIRSRFATGRRKTCRPKTRTTKPTCRRPSRPPCASCGTRSPATCWCSCPASARSARRQSTCSVPWRVAAQAGGRAAAVAPTCCWPAPRSCPSMPVCLPLTSSASSTPATPRASCWPPTWPRPR